MEGDKMKIPCGLAAFDLDGTLLSSSHTLSPKNPRGTSGTRGERYSRGISIGEDAPFYPTD